MSTTVQFSSKLNGNFAAIRREFQIPRMENIGMNIFLSNFRWNWVKLWVSTTIIHGDTEYGPGTGWQWESSRKWMNPGREYNWDFNVGKFDGEISELIFFIKFSTVPSDFWPKHYDNSCRCQIWAWISVGCWVVEKSVWKPWKISAKSSQQLSTQCDTDYWVLRFEYHVVLIKQVSLPQCGTFSVVFVGKFCSQNAVRGLIISLYLKGSFSERFSGNLIKPLMPLRGNFRRDLHDLAKFFMPLIEVCEMEIIIVKKTWLKGAHRR